MVLNNLEQVKNGSNRWTAEEASEAIPGPWDMTTCFYFDLQSGKTFPYAVSGDLVLTTEDIANYHKEVEDADRSELESFVKHQVFELRTTCDSGSQMEMVCRARPLDHKTPTLPQGFFG